jgi:hypothetical protein
MNMVTVHDLSRDLAVEGVHNASQPLRGVADDDDPLTPSLRNHRDPSNPTALL